jgi:hypothetical protein
MPEAQDMLHEEFPLHEQHVTECTGSYKDKTCDISKGMDGFGYNHEWDMRNVFLGAVVHWAQSGLKWITVADKHCGPILPQVDFKWGRPLVSMPFEYVTPGEWEMLGRERACRRHANDKSIDGNGAAYMHGNIHTLERCKAVCQKSPPCFGIEFHAKQRLCELWSEPILHSTHVSGFECHMFRPSAEHNATVNSINDIHFNQDFWTIAHMARFVRPGSRRVLTTIEGKSASIIQAFQDHDGKVTLIAMNTDKQFELPLVVASLGGHFHFTVPQFGTAVIEWSDKSCAVPRSRWLLPFFALGGFYLLVSQ